MIHICSSSLLLVGLVKKWNYAVAALHGPNPFEEGRVVRDITAEVNFVSRITFEKIHLLVRPFSGNPRIMQQKLWHTEKP